MKKMLLAVATVLTFTSAAFAQDNSKGAIVFKGDVTTSSCSVAPITEVTLGSISTRSLKTAGSSSAWVSSSIDFYDCDLKTGSEDEGVQSVSLVIEPGSPLTNDLWANVAGDAKNVGLELQVNNQTIKPEGASLADIAIFKNETLSVPVRARMQASGVASAGSFSTTINFVANYK